MKKMKISSRHAITHIQVVASSKSWLSTAVFIFFNLITTYTALAQLTVSPILRSPGKVIPQNKNARTLSTTPLSLPFFDDFARFSLDSMGNPSGQPNKKLWVNSESVWINSGMGINPPSINVATFDGLDSLNLPYEPSNVLLTGLTDKLVSQEIDLDIPIGQRNSVFLSFFYQWQGNGEAPDLNDYLLLEFKDADTVWHTAFPAIKPGEDPDNTKFINVMVKVDTPYFHKNFQFRFTRYGRKSGPFDTWNLDYIYLNSGRSAVVNTTNDVAITSPISPLFKPYYAIPVKHFFISKYVNSNLNFYVSNLYSQDYAVFYQSLASFTNYKDDTTRYEKVLELNGSLGSDVPPRSSKQATLVALPDPEDPLEFNPLSKKIDIEILIKISIDIDNDDDDSFPGIVGFNDSMRTKYILYDYYAYDDGAAEYTVELNNPGNAAALAFDMLTDNAELIAFDVYIPDFSISNNLTADFFVYDDLNGKPNKKLRTLSSTSIQKKGLNKFARITVSPVIVPKRFYIGWTEPSSGSIKVGLDYSNDNGDKIFVKIGSSWQQNTKVKGSLMIRPVFGEGNGVITDIPSTPLENEPVISALYPNPNSGTFFIQGRYDKLSIFNLLGQSIAFQESEQGNETKITIPSLSGVYLVQIQKGNSTLSRKVIVK